MKIGTRGFSIFLILDKGVLIESRIRKTTSAIVKLIMGDRKRNAATVTTRNPNALVRISREWTKLFEG